MLAFATRVLMGVVALLYLSAAAHAQPLEKLKLGSLTVPATPPVINNIIKAQKFDAKNGLDIELVLYPSISAYYAGLATGEVDVLIGGPTYFQKFWLEGVPIRIVATGITLSDLSIVTKNSAFKSLADLKGKTLAADMGSGQFQVLSIVAKSLGIDLRKDIQVINANYAVSRAQLAADRVDAAMMIEPITTMMLTENPALNLIFHAEKAWQTMTGGITGWELVYAMRSDTIKARPQVVKKFIDTLKDTSVFMREHSSAADKIVSETTKLPAGTIKAAIAGRRLNFLPLPIGAAEKKSLLDMMQRAVDAQFHPKMPSVEIFHAD